MKKTLYPILFVILLFFTNCKKNENTNINEVTLSENKSINLNIGDSIIADNTFIKQLKSSSDYQDSKKLLKKIRFDYEKYSNWKSKDYEEFKIGEIKIKLSKNKQKKPDADIFSSIEIAIYKDVKKIDSKFINIEENYSEALVAKKQYFYIDDKLKLFILSIIEDEEGIKIESYSQYSIDPNGKIILLDTQNQINNIVEETDNSSNTNDAFNGVYEIIVKNRDNLKTTFKINIKNINSIDVNYNDSENGLESYKDLNGELIDNNKIKVIFNPKYEEMGEFFIEKSGNTYFISGASVAMINPGNDQYEINKIK